MSRLIDADALRKKATVVTKYDEGGWGVDLLAVPLCDVELAPTIEVEPVRHGRWIDMGVENETGNIYFCSACFECYNPNKKNVEMGRAKEKPNYCPNCGVKMDEEDV